MKYYHKEGESQEVAVVELDSDSAEIAEKDVITEPDDNDQVDHTQHCSASVTDNSFHRLFDSDDNDSESSFEGFLPEDISKD